MSDNNNQNSIAVSVSIWPTVWKWALILAVFKAAYTLVIPLAGLGDMPGTGLLGTVIVIVLLVVALRSYRGSNNGYMSFGRAFGIAFVASFVSTLLRAAVNSIYLGTAGEDGLTEAREQALSQVQGNPAVDAQTLEMMRNVFDVLFTPGGTFIMAIIGGTIGWTVVALILAGVLRKAPPLSG